MVMIGRIAQWSAVALLVMLAGCEGSGSTNKVVYSVSGTVTGLEGTSTVVLSLINPSTNHTYASQAVSSTASSGNSIQFAFLNGGVPAGAAYSVVVSSQPSRASGSSLDETCTATGGSGTIPGSGRRRQRR